MVSPHQARILVIEDEPAQREMLVYNLEKEGYEVLVAGDGEEGLLVAKEEQPDTIVLDWMLPSLSGIEVCRQLKSANETSEIPVILLTARGEEADRVRGLDTGADDYVVKPYSITELNARVRARFQHRATRGDNALKLGPTEFKLLTVFLERPRRVWSRDSLLDKVWGHDSYVDHRTVDVHVGRLRKILNAGGARDLIRTVRGAGYSLDKE